MGRCGVLCPRANQSVAYEIDGPAEIVGLGNGDATSLESFKGSEMKLFNGMAVVSLRSMDGPSANITLHAAAAGLQSAIAQLKTETGARL